MSDNERRQDSNAMLMAAAIYAIAGCAWLLLGLNGSAAGVLTPWLFLALAASLLAAGISIRSLRPRRAMRRRTK